MIVLGALLITMDILGGYNYEGYYKMSQVHDHIALAALEVQNDEIRKVFNPYIKDLLKSSWYPDFVAKIKKTKDAHFLWPSPPKTPWQKKLQEYSLESKYWSWCGEPPLMYVYLCRHYLDNIVRCLKSGDIKSAVKYCGVYSHLIADTIEPGHAVFDWAVDIFAPVSFQNSSGKEIYTNKECLRGPIDIKGYRPKLLVGDNIKQVEMSAVAEIIKGSKFGAAYAVPLDKALYSGKIKKARQLHSQANNEITKQFADFIYTVFNLAKKSHKTSGCHLDLCKHPFISAEVSSYCRFRPLVDVFTDPACFATSPPSVGTTVMGNYILKTKPLALLSENGRKVERVRGLCVIPTNIKSEATVEYFLVPGAYRKFSTRVGLNPTLKKSLPFLSAVFTVLGEGKELARSKPVKPGDRPVHIQAELGKTRFMTLSMKYSCNVSSEKQEKFRRRTSAVHGIWAEPTLCQDQ